MDTPPDVSNACRRHFSNTSVMCVTIQNQKIIWTHRLTFSARIDNVTNHLKSASAKWNNQIFENNYLGRNRKKHTNQMEEVQFQFLVMSSLSFPPHSSSQRPPPSSKTQQRLCTEFAPQVAPAVAKKIVQRRN